MISTSRSSASSYRTEGAFDPSFLFYCPNWIWSHSLFSDLSLFPPPRERSDIPPRRRTILLSIPTFFSLFYAPSVVLPFFTIKASALRARRIIPVPVTPARHRSPFVICFSPFLFPSFLKNGWAFLFSLSLRSTLSPRPEFFLSFSWDLQRRDIPPQNGQCPPPLDSHLDRSPSPLSLLHHPPPPLQRSANNPPLRCYVPISRCPLSCAALVLQAAAVRQDGRSFFSPKLSLPFI